MNVGNILLIREFLLKAHMPELFISIFIKIFIIMIKNKIFR